MINRIVVLVLLLSLFLGGTISAESVTCSDNYVATIFADNLVSPDGLAFSPTGILHVAEETVGQISSLSADGTATPILTGLSSPEGIAFDTAGALYVVEDVQNGRLIKQSGMTTTTIATGLDAPEGVVIGTDDTIYITESNAQFVTNPLTLQSRVSAVSQSGVITPLVTAIPQVDGFNVEFISASGITQGDDGLLYVANETSLVTETYDVGPFTFTLTTTKSIFTIDPSTSDFNLFASHLVAVEGLRFNPITFPLYAIEEDIGDGSGRLSRVSSDGTTEPFCTGFGNLEDVAVADDGTIFVSDDSNGVVWEIRPNTPTAITTHTISTHTTIISPLILIILCISTVSLLNGLSSPFAENGLENPFNAGATRKKNGT